MHRKIQPLFLALVFCLVACKKSPVGNGGSYVGGGDGSTQAQVLKALDSVKKNFAAAILDLSSGKKWDKLLALENCDTAEAICYFSVPHSMAQRRFARDLILSSLSGLRVELVTSPTDIQVVEEFPDLEDAYGHPRNSALAATTAERGAVILLSGPRLRLKKPAELEWAIAEAIGHDITHHMTGVGDRVSFGPFEGDDGGQEAHAFVGEIFRALLYPDSLRQGLSDEIRARGAISAKPDHDSSVVASLDVPGGEFSSAPATVVTDGRLHLFGVGKQDRKVYQASFNGIRWSGFSAVHAYAVSDTKISVIEYRRNGVLGLLMAAQNDGLVRLFWKGGASWEWLGVVSNFNLSTESDSTDRVRTPGPPSLSTHSGRLYLYILGADGQLYGNSVVANSNEVPQNFVLQPYTGLATEGPMAQGRSNGGAILMASANGSVTKLRWLTNGPISQGSISANSKRAPGVTLMGYVEWLAWTDKVSGKVFLAGADSSIGAWVAQPPKLNNRETDLAPSIVAYGGQLRLYTTGPDGWIYETLPQ